MGMKKFYVVLFSLLFPLILYAITPTAPAMRSGGNYTTLYEAISAPNTDGVSSPVVFKIADGNYAEQVVIGEISGASASISSLAQAPTTPSSNLTFTSIDGDRFIANYTEEMDKIESLLQAKVQLRLSLWMERTI